MLDKASNRLSRRHMEDQTTPTQPPPEPPPQRRLERSRDDRILAGVCGGIARYFGVDATVVRIVAVGLTLLGGAGVLLYIAALLLMPEQGSEGATISLSGEGRTQAATAIAVIVVALAAFAALAVVGAVIGWVLFPIAALVVAGLLAWWLASGERPEGSPGQLLARAAMGVGLLVLCFALALGGAWAAGTGSGAVGAGLVIAAGVVLVAAAFTRPARWLILPALSLGLAAGFVTAAGIDLDGGVGQRQYHPTAATDIHNEYKLGVGELVVDLRDARLPAGDRTIEMNVGVGHALLLVPANACVTTDGRAGVGAVDVFNSTNGGVDVKVADSRTPRPGAPRIVLKGDVGLGLVEVAHERQDGYGPGSHRRLPGPGQPDETNSGCVGSVAQVGSGLGPVG
jgi:phage shock protein PspC (stress-responsive transcriptional regulator)